MHDTCIYMALIVSLFDYCCPVFIKLTKKLWLQITKVEKRAHRIIYGYSETADCGCTCDGFVSRRDRLSLRLLHKIQYHGDQHILPHKAPKPMPHTRRSQLRTFACRTARRLDSFFPSVTMLHNSSVQFTSFFSFLQCVSCYFIVRFFSPCAEYSPGAYLQACPTLCMCLLSI